MSRYDDIINLSHYELRNHKKMSMESRVAQFAPYSALTGYSDLIKESNRLTKEKIILSEDMKLNNDINLKIIEEHIKEFPKIRVLYFVKDNKKTGGEYVEYTGNVRIIDIANRYIIFTSKKKIYIDDIYEINIELDNKNKFSTYN